MYVPGYAKLRSPEHYRNSTLNLFGLIQTVFKAHPYVAFSRKFLSNNKIVQRDLAARNVVVCDKRVVKISGSGLSRDIYLENIYRKTESGRMPFKWMAIESLMHQVHTTHSDVWAFGILLWEIVTFRCDPYPGIPTIEILKRLQTGYRMERPPNCSVPLYNVMISCWETKPGDRPTFTILRKELETLVSLTAEQKHIDGDDVSEGMLLEQEDSENTGFQTSLRPM